MMTEPNSEQLSTDPAQILREAGLRATQQRTSVLTILAASTDHPTVDDVYDKARQLDDSVSIATIYRTMLLLETAGLIRKLTFDDAPARYEMTPNRDHDHLIDIDTGELIEIPGREISELRARIVNDLGYDVVSQHTILRGRRKH
ncbi:Fur family transcriptional regulator, ferric uptake regulator [Loktanella salsilacus]|jgi:Fur family ferric uptake transcriptional regulator|uniref:Ferric uptake regulation protein n=1 Tax=Loktanella salsilacus TaxID=195913 RepID=A0A1I4JA60_9RHOB|nr:Fur family transcriptional regulator [Loktanella salsilacus]SFL63006.1 Fur family transcriptional regulator, ferric uptake regulator [Loktanella salsilacus]